MIPTTEVEALAVRLSWMHDSTIGPEAATMLRALAAERDAAVKDAERYQWIRDNAKDGAVKTLLPLYRAHYFVSLEPIDECPTFDAAIDAAILAAKGEK